MRRKQTKPPAITVSAFERFKRKMLESKAAEQAVAFARIAVDASGVVDATWEAAGTPRAAP